MSLNERVVEVMKERLDIVVSDDGVLETDELQVVELVIALEEEFGLKIPDDDHHRLQNVAGVKEYISVRKIGASGGL
jgi:acyl carrier protein